jgi:hypothetical protein
MDERYHNGVFEPMFAPGPQPDCSAAKLTRVADFWAVQVLRFDRVACAGGWALAIGTGAGFSSPVVGLFDRGAGQNGWQVLTLDNGTALPAAPSIYDLPLALVVQLASRLGPVLTPEVAAAKLIAQLQSRYNFAWPQQDGVVIDQGTEWLVAPVPAGPAPHDSPRPVAAIIYRWSGTTWKADGRIPRLPSAMNIGYFGGWFTAVAAKTSTAVAFQLAGSESGTAGVITNQGGSWHVQSSH